MKKAGFILFLNMLGSLLAAQHISTFNKIYTVIPGMPCSGQRVTVYPDGYIIYGETNDATNLSRVSVTKIDTFGNLLWNKSYGKAGYDYFFGNVPGGSDGVSVPWGGYIEAGYVSNSSQSWCKSALFRFDDKGDTLWTKVYNDSTNEIGITVKLNRKKKYIVGGMWEINNYRFFTTTLKETDTLGNTIWQKTYQGLPSHSRETLCLDTCKDGGYIICAFDGDTNYEYYYWCGSGKMFIMKTDSAGTPQWTQYINDPICLTGPNYVLSLHDGSYLVGGSYVAFENNGGYNKFNKLYLAKISATGSVKWTKQYGAGSWGGSLLFSLKELPNGDIIACGNDSISNGFSSNISCDYGCILKVDSNGNQKWLRYYAMQSPTEQDYLLDIQPTSDGGYVAAGATYGSTQNIWVVKVDSLGCDTVGCDFTGITKFTTFNSQFKLYPNPANNKLNIEYLLADNSLNANLIIYDIIGNKIMEVLLPTNRNAVTLNVSSLSSGLYVYSLVNNSGVIQRGKVSIIR